MNNDLRRLLIKMSGREDISSIKGSETTSWQAYRIAEKINDLKLVHHLTGFIEEENKNYDLKREAYQLLSFILKNTKNVELANQLLQKSAAEDKNDDTLYVILTGIWESKVALNMYIENILFYIDDSRELIRNMALRVLSLFTHCTTSNENTLIDVVHHPYDQYDLRYAIQALGSIGMEKSIHTLNTILLQSQNVTIREEIESAIKKINSRL